MCTIEYGINEYHAKYGHYPPAVYVSPEGHTHSWRVLILEFVNSSIFSKYRFDEAWNGPNNHKLENLIPNCYSCPGNPASKSKFQSNYYAVTGDGTAFPPNARISRDKLAPLKDTAILFVESSSYGIHWMEPKDLSLRSICPSSGVPDLSNITSEVDNGPYCCLIDGTKLRIRNIPTDRLCASFNADK
jgi:hypothetical protein